MTKTDNVTYTILHGDCLDRLKELPDNSVDSVVTDPPYGLSKEPDINEVEAKRTADKEHDHGHGGCMGKSWDSFVPHPDIWKEVHRVLKPGGHALVFAGTRTQDLMTISLRLAGFEVRDVIEWLYFSGFPKSHNVSKAFDRRAGAEREVVGRRTDGRYKYGFSEKATFDAYAEKVGGSSGFSHSKSGEITAPATDLARKWDGWGTSLKPSHEPIIVVRKPLIDADTGRKLTVADCVEKYGTGAINVDASRIATFGEDAEKHKAEWNRTQSAKQSDTATFLSPKEKEADLRAFAKDGRFPANCITLDEGEFYSKYFDVSSVANITPQELSKKASKKDRNSDWKGEEIDGNSHPTVKPTDLMAWLVRLVTPEGGTVLDPFAGSGSTLVAAKREGFGFVGVELTEDYIPIIEARTGVKAEGRAKV